MAIKTVAYTYKNSAANIVTTYNDGSETLSNEVTTSGLPLGYPNSNATVAVTNDTFSQAIVTTNGSFSPPTGYNKLVLSTSSGTSNTIIAQNQAQGIYDIS